MEVKDLLLPGWYLARDIKSKWWNLFVYFTKEPPYRCIQTINGELHYTNITPEKISEVSPKRISLGEFKIIQDLQKRLKLKGKGPAVESLEKGEG